MSLKSAVIAMFMILLMAGILNAGNMETKNIVIPADNIKKLIVNADLSVGIYTVIPDDMEEILKADIEYNDRRLEVFTDYEKEGDIGYIDLGTRRMRKTDFDTDDNVWDIKLSNRYPVEMEFDIAACEADIDLGGIPITYLDFNMGVADGKLDFSRPNPETAARVNFDAGAGKFEIERLGNLNFKRLYLDGGMGKFIIDFSGKYTMKSRAKISLGLASAVIYLPKDLPFRIEADENFLSSIDFDELHEFEAGDNYYESNDYDQSDYGLDLFIDVGIGSVSIEWSE